MESSIDYNDLNTEQATPELAHFCQTKNTGYCGTFTQKTRKYIKSPVMIIDNMLHKYYKLNKNATVYRSKL